MADHGALDGSIDEAALAIQALMDGPAQQDAGAEPGEDQDIEDTAAAIEAQQPSEAQPEADAPAQEQTEQNTVEEAPEGDKPDASAQAEPVQAPVQAQAPQPVVTQPVPQVAAPQAIPSTAKDQLAQLEQAVPILQGQLNAAFPDIKNDDDLQRVAMEDPARAIAYTAAERKVQSVVRARDNAQAAYRNEWLATQTAELHKAIPDMADPQKGPALGARMTAFAKSIGYTDDQIKWASAADVIMLHESMLYREGQSAAKAKAEADAKALEQAKKKAAEAPPVQKPGAAKPTTGKADKLKELEERASKTGRVDDLAALLAYREMHPGA